MKAFLQGAIYRLMFCLVLSVDGDGSDIGWDTMQAKIHIQILLALPYKSTLIKGALSNAEFSEAVFCVKTNQHQLVSVKYIQYISLIKVQVLVRQIQMMRIQPN